MITPRWPTTATFITFIVLFIVSWVRSRKTGKSFREAVLPTALMTGGVSICFARQFFGDLPVWIEVSILIPCLLLILGAVGLRLVQFKHYLKESWRLEYKSDK